MKQRYQPHCKKCGRPIGFVKTANGASMPVNPVAIYAVADPGGDLAIITDAGRIIRVREARDGDRDKMVGHVPHWIRCAGAEEIKREYGTRRKAAQSAARDAQRREAERQRREKPVEPQTEQLRLFGG